MAKAKKLPSGNWRVLARVTLDGRQLTRSFTASTAREAERNAYEWQEHCKMIGSDSTRMTVKEAMLNYIELNSHRLSPSTEAEYVRIADNDMVDIIDKPLYALTCPIIQQSVVGAASRLSPKTIKNRYGFLRTVLSIYYPDFVWAVSFPKKQSVSKRAYSHQYINDILQAVSGTDMELECYLGILSMRASEIAGIKWEDIDFKNKTLHICRAKIKNKDGEYIVVDYTKTEKSDRIVYLPDYVCELLKKRKSETNNEFVSSISPNRYWQKFNAILKKSNLEKLGFHKLRHIYSSLTSALGIDSQVRMENGGWSNEHIMNGTYRHAMSEAQKEANEKLNNYVNNVTQANTKMNTRKPKRLKLVRYIEV